MITIKSKKIIIFYVTIFFLSLTIFPNTSLANPIWYGRLVTLNQDSVILEFRGLENKYYYSCNIESLECSILPGLPIENPSLPTKEDEKKPTIKFPAGSTRKNISESGNFGFYTTSNTSKKTRTIGLIDGKKKKYYSINENLYFWNLLQEQSRISRFSKDDSSLTYMSDISGYSSLYNVSLKNLSKNNYKGTQITKGVSVGDYIYADNETILFVANTLTDPYNWNLYSYNINTKTTITLAQNISYATTLRQSDNSIFFNKLNSFGTFPVVLTDFKIGEVKEFKNIPEPSLYPESISYTYEKISGLNTVEMKNDNIIVPKHPLIIWLHGGPYRQSSYTRHPYISYGVYDWLLEEAVNKGAYILKIDYPGSYGAGRKFTESIKGGVGTTDIKSIINTVNTYKKTHVVSGVYMVGNSYGGYLALKFMTSHPKQIDGGLSINGVTDWTSLLKYYKTSIFNIFFNGKPSTSNKKLYSNASILNNVKLIKNPIYIVQGEIDATIPKSQALILKKALDSANKKSELIMIPEENHIFLKNSSLNIICNSLFEMIQLDATNSCNLEG